jgi:hypothetical protein
MATTAAGLIKPVGGKPSSKVKASTKTRLIARYHRLVDLQSAKGLTPAQAEELDTLNKTFNSWEATETVALERHFDRKAAEADRLLAEIKRTRLELANVSSSQKTKTAGSS